jgi:hypothetical protein
MMQRDNRQGVAGADEESLGSEDHVAITVSVACGTLDGGLDAKKEEQGGKGMGSCLKNGGKVWVGVARRWYQAN